VVDGRIRKVTYQLSSNTTTITAILPHFWDYADVDPDFSLLHGDKNGDCKKKSGDSHKTLKIVVSVVLVLALIACVLIVMYPKMKFWWHNRHNRRGVAGRVLSEGALSMEMNELTFSSLRRMSEIQVEG